MAVPRLTQLECFIELDPRWLRDDARRVASIKGAIEFGRPVHPREMPNIDLVVAGSVAVARDGSRIGKGGGYSDLEYALLAELGRVDDATPIITTVHECQVSDEPLLMHEHDISLDFIVTPDDIIPCARVHQRPAGISWNLLARERIEAMPIVEEVWRGLSGATVG
jgi:5-formyltetrahydrofolate cyclo-ligase